MENQIIQINLVPNMSTPAVVRVSQYDVGRPLVFKVYDGTSPADLTGVTAVIKGTKRSGLGFSESGTVSDNTVTLDTTLAMTQEDGSIPAEIRFSKTGEDVGTANFLLCVEKTPHEEGTTDGTHETMADLQSQLDALDERVEALEAGGGGSGLTDDVKNALLQIAQKVAYIDENGQTYYGALHSALYPPAYLTSITCVYTQSGAVYDNTPLNDLKTDLVVTAHYDDSTTQTVTAYTLSGLLTVGTSTITVSYGGKTTTFNVTVSATEHYLNATLTYQEGHSVTASDGTVWAYDSTLGYYTTASNVLFKKIVCYFDEAKPKGSLWGRGESAAQGRMYECWIGGIQAIGYRLNNVRHPESGSYATASPVTFDNGTVYDSVGNVLDTYIASDLSFNCLGGRNGGSPINQALTRIVADI